MSRIEDKQREDALWRIVFAKEEELGRPLTEEEIDDISEEDILDEVNAHMQDERDYDSEWKDDFKGFPWRNPNGN